MFTQGFGLMSFALDLTPALVQAAPDSLIPTLSLMKQAFPPRMILAPDIILYRAMDFLIPMLMQDFRLMIFTPDLASVLLLAVPDSPIPAPISRWARTPSWTSRQRQGRPSPRRRPL